MSGIELSLAIIGLVTVGAGALYVVAIVTDFFIDRFRQRARRWPVRKYGFFRTMRYRIGLALIRPVMDRYWRRLGDRISKVDEEWGAFQAVTSEPSTEERNARRMKERFEWERHVLLTLYKLEVQEPEL